MQTPSHDRLADQQYVVLLLRLLVDRRRQIVHGDAGGPDELDPKIERWIHFHGPTGLLVAVQTWLAREAAEAEPPPSVNP
jgi:hypothetical protein